MCQPSEWLHPADMRIAPHHRGPAEVSTHHTAPKPRIETDRPVAADGFAANRLGAASNDPALNEAMLQVLNDALQQLIKMMSQMQSQLSGGAGQGEEAPTLKPLELPKPLSMPPPKPQPQAAAPAAEPSSSPAPTAQFSIGPGSEVRPRPANLPDVSNEPFPLELEDFTREMKIEYGATGWQKTDGTELTPREEAIAWRRSNLLGEFHNGSVTMAANNARAAGTTLTAHNMTFFLGDGSAPKMPLTGLRGMNPQWVPGQGPPPQFDSRGAPIPGTVGAVVGGINASSSSGSNERWPPAPATAEQHREYDRYVASMRAGHPVISSSGGPGLPPPANPRTVELAAQKKGRVSIDSLNDLAHRLTLDAVRFEAVGGKVSAQNAFANNQALFDAYKRGDAEAFAAALG